MIKFLVSVALFSTLLFGGINNNDNKIDYGKLDKISSKRLIQIISSNVAKNLPMTIDKACELINVFSFNNFLVYIKEVNINNVVIHDIWLNKKDDFIKAMFKGDSQNACHNQLLKYLVHERGVIIKLKYIDTEANPLFDYTIDKNDCEKLL